MKNKKIYYFFGKSGSGKDLLSKTVYDFLKYDNIDIKILVPYTTRPMRVNETNGVQYNFISNKEFEKMKNTGELLEYREYETVKGKWYYGTKFDIKNNNQNYIYIGTYNAYKETIKKNNNNFIFPIEIITSDYKRLLRLIKREHLQEEPRYDEICRRFITDKEDFPLEHEKYIHYYCNDSDDYKVAAYHIYTDIKNDILAKEKQ